MRASRVEEFIFALVRGVFFAFMLMIFLVSAAVFSIQAYTYIADPEPPTLDEMRQFCREDAHLNEASPDDQEHVSRCVDGWVRSVMITDEIDDSIGLGFGVATFLVSVLSGNWIFRRARRFLAKSAS